MGVKAVVKLLLMLQPMHLLEKLGEQLAKKLVI
jgi:hypothetical protein